MNAAIANIPLTTPRDFIRTQIEIAARRHGVSVKEIMGPPRGTYRASVARCEAMRTIRATHRLSYPQLGRLFGGRDHSTVIYHCSGECRCAAHLARWNGGPKIAAQ